MNYTRYLLRHATRSWARRNGVPPWFAWFVVRKTRRHTTR